MKTKFAITFLIFISALVGRAVANPGDLDTTFGAGGTYSDTAPSYPCYGMFPAASTLQSDGKILVAGKIYNRCSTYGYSDDPVNLRRVLLRRYLADGTPDNGGGTQGEFGMDGFGVTEAPISPNVYGEGFDVLVQPDGYIVVAGSKAARGGTTAAVWRFTPDGELDTTFGNDGVVTFTSSGTYNASRKLVFWNGNIFVAGYSTPNGIANVWVRKLNTDGSLHVWFGSGGKLSTGLETQTANVTIAISSANGYIFVGGISGTSAVVAKYSSSGTIFTNFGNFGLATLPNCTPGGGYTPTYPIVPLDLRFQSSGKLLVVSRMSYGGWAETPGMHRLTAAGFVDTSFVDTTQYGSCNAVVQGSTWVRVASNDFLYSGSRRFIPDGSKDTSFIPAANTMVSGEVQPGDGKIVYLSYDTFLSPGKTYSDSRVKLFRLLP